MNPPQPKIENYQPALPDRIGPARGLPESRNPAARQRCREGDEAIGAGDLAAAEDAYRAALAADGECILAHHNLGVVSYMQGNWEGARSCFERCARLAPQQADPHFNAGLCALRQEREEEAQRAFEAAVALHPGHTDARFQLALHYARGSSPGSARRREAVDALRYILDACRRGAPCASLDRACFLLGSFLDDMPENRAESIAVYRQGLEADPLFAPGHNNLGVLLMQSGQAIPALGCFKIALHLEPDYALPYRNLARLLFDYMSPSQMEREFASIADEFGVRSSAILARLSLELIDLGRAQVFESLYTQGHQIKNLMGVMGSRMRRALRSLPPGTEGLDDLHEIAREQERIYDQWVVYLRSMKQDPMNPTLVDIPRLVRKTIDTVSIREGGKAIRFASEEHVPQVEADPGMLHEAVGNLILNALDAVGEDGEITVQTGHDPGRAAVYIEVEDNGPGIPRDLQPKIFDPGFSTKERGNGYGLSICARIVSAHRGNIRVVSRPGAGTVFRIDLPIDFELVSEEEAIGLQRTAPIASRSPLTEEFIETDGSR